MGYVETQRGQKALVFGRRSFRFKEEYKNGYKRWLCRARRCNGSFITSSEVNVILKKQGHSCAQDDAKIDVEKMRCQGLKRCREELTPIPKIHRDTIAAAFDHGSDLVAKVPKLTSSSSACTSGSKANTYRACGEYFIEGK